MTLNDILVMGFNIIVHASTIVYLREGSNIIARGHWYQDNIRRYCRQEVMFFSVNLETNTLSVKLRGAD